MVLASVEETQSHLPAPPARAATLRASPSSALPAGSSLRALQEENPFQVFSCPHKIKKNGEGKQNQKTRPTNKHRDKGRYSHLSRRGTIQISMIHSIQNRVGTTKEE